MRWWQTLGVPRSADRDTVRRAYARLLKTTNPEDDPEGFMALRAAYDAALDDLKWRARSENSEGFQPLAPEMTEADAPAAGPPPEEAPQAEPALPQPDPEAIARAAAFAELESRQRALVAALDARQDREALLAAFDAVLAAPIAEEIDVRAGIELWLAMVIADFRGVSDPLVMPAIRRFGWDHAVSGRQHPAIADVVRRRAEGELVNQMSRPHAPLHLGFEALRKAPGPGWRMRLTALFTGAPDEVRRLLAMIDSEMPGLVDWLDADAIAWWRDWLGTPRQSTETLALAPLGALFALLIVAVGGLPAWVGWLGAALSLALPVAAQRLVLQPQWRLQDNPWDAPDWLWWGWIPALLALFPVAGVLPESGWSAVLLAALMVPVLGWLTVVTPLPDAPGLAARARAILGTVWPFGVLALTAARMLEPVPALLWMEVTLAAALAWWRGSEAMAAPLRRRLGQWGLPVLVAFAAAMVLGALVPRGADAARWVMLAITAAMLALYLANRMLTPDRWRWLLLVGWGVLAFALLTQIGRQAPARPPQASTRSAPAVPGAPPGGEPARPIGDEQNWVRASDYPESAFPGPGTYKVAVNLAIGSEGKVILCTAADGTPARLADPTCAALRQRARFTPARDARGKVAPSLLLWRTVWTVRGGATTTKEPAAAPAPAAPRPLRQAACPADTRSSAPGTALPPAPCEQPSWFQDGDYPEAAARAGQQGTVAWELAVDAGGGVTGCTVTAGSGSAALDAETCRLLMGRARFLPARDASGAPEPSTARGRMTWRLRP